MGNKKMKLSYKSVLKLVAGPVSKQVGIRMPLELIRKFDSLKKEAEAAGYTLNMSELCVRSIEEAVESAARELDQILAKKVSE